MHAPFLAFRNVCARDCTVLAQIDCKKDKCNRRVEDGSDSWRVALAARQFML